MPKYETLERQSLGGVNLRRMLLGASGFSGRNPLPIPLHSPLKNRAHSPKMGTVVTFEKINQYRTVRYYEKQSSRLNQNQKDFCGTGCTVGTGNYGSKNLLSKVRYRVPELPIYIPFLFKI